MSVSKRRIEREERQPHSRSGDEILLKSVARSRERALLHSCHVDDEIFVFPLLLAEGEREGE